MDERPVRSVACFFAARGFRRRGVTVRLLKAAVEYARRRGATIEEGYPVLPTKGSMPKAFAYRGLRGAFARAAFTEVAPRSRQRSVVRREL